MKNNDTMPRVTRLDTPSSITTTADGTVQITKNNTSPTTTTKMMNHPTKDTEKQPMIFPPKKIKKDDDEWTKNGDSFIDEQFQQQIQTYWCQDRYEVILSIVLLDNNNNHDTVHTSISTRHLQVKVKGPSLVSYADRFSAMGMTQKQMNENQTILTVSSIKRTNPNNNNNNNTHIVWKKDPESNKRITVFQGSLPHPIHLAEDEEDVEWELVSPSSSHAMKVLRITFRKALPMQGLTIWWDQPLLHFPKINLQNDIPERGMAKMKNNDNNSTKMKQVWDEAHALFREKIKQKKEQTSQINDP